MHQPTVARLALMIALSGASAAPGAAQSDTTSRPGLCWRGRPLPHCGAFWITEFGYDVVMSTTLTRYALDYGSGNTYDYASRDFDSRFTWAVGPMFNYRPLRAVGGTLTLSPMGTGARAALEGRYRWWTPEGSAFDLSAGIVRVDLPRTEPPYDLGEYGLTAGAFLVGGDLINVNGRADLLLTGGKARYGTSLGIGLGSYAAAGGTLALGALFLILISSIRD